MPDRKCQTCDGLESRHYADSWSQELGPEHQFAVRPGDEWCHDCGDWVVNGCGSLAECDERARDESEDREGVWS